MDRNVRIDRIGIQDDGSAVKAIAVIGWSRRFPAARNAVEAVRGVDDGVELFDAGFFGLNPGEAFRTDPQHRLFLECAWQAMEDAGYDSQCYPGRIGLFGGSSVSSYLFRLLDDPETIARDRDALAARVSRRLGLSGPCLTVPTSDLAVHLAVLSLLQGDVDMALAGGASVNLPPVPGEGAGVVVLKRLEDALAEGDSVRAVIRSSAIHADPAGKTTAIASAGIASLLEAVLARRAAVSLPGADGAGVRLTLEEAPEGPRQPSRPWQALVLSARTEAALEKATVRLAGFLRDHPEADLGDVAFTLQAGRRAFDHRRALVCRDAGDALAALEGSAAGRLETFAGGGVERRVSFLLPGFGDHYPDMALGLYREEPAFRRVVDDCCERLLPELGFDLRAELFPGLAAGGAESPAVSSPSRLDLRRLVRGEERGTVERRLTRMATVHPAVFVVEYALAQLLMGWGIRPRAMLGYSLGEYTAACLAGVLSLGDCLTLVARRARLIEELPPGAMLAVPLPIEEIEPLLRDGLGIAVVNGPDLHVVSGPVAAVEALEARLAANGVVCRRLLSDHAGHSPMMESIAGRLRELLAGFELRPPRIPYVSNVTGTWIRPEEATDPDYWVRHLCGRVLFGDGLGRLLETGAVLLEVGPGQSLTSFAKQHPAGGLGRASLMFSTLRSAYNVQPDRAFLLGTLGRLWLAGVPIDWRATHVDERRRIPLPTYPFERQRYWLEEEERRQPEAVETLLAGHAGRVHIWPNGLRVVHQGLTEAEHFYQDIFEKQIYRRHGVELRDGACVFDVGANIGTFMLYAHQVCRGARIYSFEPAPPLFEKLRLNAALNRVEARLFNFGISDREGTAEFTFYPHSSGMSSFHADKRQEKEILRLMMEKEREAGVEGVGELMDFADDLLEARFRSESFQCRLRPLSSVVAECEVEWIDLLKIDVQKAELEVLAGLREEHWPIVGQIVMEVHDLDGRLERIARLLEERGFRVAVEQDELLRGSVLYNLFAVREGWREAASPARAVLGVRYAAPESELERGLAEIWQRALRIEKIGVDDNFFDLGGTSLTGLQVVNEIRSRLGLELSPVAIFEAPTVRTLALGLRDRFVAP
jgi:phthiocerol/phenolphthiocerol synthesis type-I polyketide synthase E